MSVTVRGDRGAFGAVLTPGQASPLRLGALPARATSSALLSVGANGDVVAGALAAADLPSVFTRRDVAETINASWTWAAGQTITFAAGGPLAIPLLTGRSTGTRLVVEPVAGSTEHAVGRETGALWTSVPAGAAHKWYQGATERLRLDTDGTLCVLNGSGNLALAASGSGVGQVSATSALALSSTTAGITLGTASGAILPYTNYFENLGLINRKFLALHAAELWVETLVAQSTMATIGGRILVGPTTQLTRDAAPTDATIYVKHNTLGLYVVGIEHGSKLVFEAAGKFEVMTVDQTTAPVQTAQGDYPYHVIRAHGGTANQWYAGDAAFDTGKATAPTGAFMDLYSVRGVNPGTTQGPTIVGNMRFGQAATDWREFWAIGQLLGIYGNSVRKFGAAFGDTQGMHIQIDNTDGIRFLGSGGSAGVVYGQWDMAANLSLGYSNAGQLVFTAADGSLRMRVNGADKMALLADGSMWLNAALIVGGFSGATGVVRSANALDWNSGSGFVFKYVQATNLTTALIGSSTGRRVTWDGASLKVVSDGLTIDENGITMGQQGGTSPTEPGKVIKFGTGAGQGLTLWDSAGSNYSEISRYAGSLTIVSLAGTVMLQGGGSGLQRTTLTMALDQVAFGGTGAGAGFLKLVPATDNYWDLGTTALRWRNSYMVSLSATTVLASSSVQSAGYVTVAGAVPNAYWLQSAQDSCAKPVSSTWTILPSDRAAKDDIVPVDPAAALALVRRVPLVRFRYNGQLGGPAGVAGIGVVAQDIEPILPATVQRGHNGAVGWNPHELLMLNVAAVQALADRLDGLERTPRDS